MTRQLKGIPYTVIRSRRRTADIVVERNGDPEVVVGLRNGQLLISKHLLKRTASPGSYAGLLHSRGEEIQPARVQQVVKKVGVRSGRVRVKELGYHWASCGARGDQNFHWKALMAPRTALDCIIVHEPCHPRHRDHSAAF